MRLVNEQYIQRKQGYDGCKESADCATRPWKIGREAFLGSSLGIDAIHFVSIMESACLRCSICGQEVSNQQLITIVHHIYANLGSWDDIHRRFAHWFAASQQNFENLIWAHPSTIIRTMIADFEKFQWLSARSLLFHMGANNAFADYLVAKLHPLTCEV